MFYRLKSNACIVYKIPIRPILPIDQQFLFQTLIFLPVHKNSKTLSSYFVHQNWQMLQLKKLHCLPRFEPSALLFSAGHSNSFSVVYEVDHVPPTKATIVTVLILGVSVHYTSFNICGTVILCQLRLHFSLLDRLISEFFGIEHF